jgi:hypothetical protein
MENFKKARAYTPDYFVEKGDEGQATVKADAEDLV